MILGNKKTYFSKSHIENTKGYAPAYLNELVIYSLELVSLLSYSKIPFRFKGGNSLLLILDEPERFSIDVDIVSTISKRELIDTVKNIVELSSLFYKFDIRQHKTKPWLPMISFKIYFHSHYQKPADSFIMLDAVLEPPPYDGMIKKIKLKNIYESNLSVEVPTINGLIADKLLTLGPSTLGIPLGKGKEAHRLKHVFDLSQLIQKPYDIKQIKIDLKACMEQENKIQKSNFSFEEVMKDTIQFLSEPLKFEKEKPPLDSIESLTYLYEIVYGFDDFIKHLFRKKYSWQDFIQTVFKSLLNFIKNELI